MTVSPNGTPTNGNSGTNAAIVLPTGWSVGDACYIIISPNSGTLSVPTGWSQVGAVSAVTPHLQVFRRILQSGDSGPTITNSVACAWGVVGFSGSDTTTPEDGTPVTFSTATTGSTVAAGPMTPTRDGGIILTAYGNGNGKTGTPPAGATEQVDVQRSTLVGLQINTESSPASGVSTGTKTETLSGNGGNELSIMILIQPPAPAPYSGWGVFNIT